MQSSSPALGMDCQLRDLTRIITPAGLTVWSTRLVLHGYQPLTCKRPPVLIGPGGFDPDSRI